MNTAGTSLPLYNVPTSDTAKTAENKRIEDYRPGYPRYTALLAAHDPYFICRRFSKLRARVLLQKQNELSILEEELERIDQEERCALFLGKIRSDKNPARIALISDIEAQLTDYDQFANHTFSMLSFSIPQERDVESLQNWLDGNGCLAEEECAYLAYRKDLVSLAPSGDKATLQFEVWVEDLLIRFWRSFRRTRHHNLSDDPNVYIYSGQLVQRLARILLLLLITLLLLIPVVVCNMINTFSIRIVVVMLSTISYLLVLSVLTKSKTMELILAGATYATVLIVFVSGTTIASG